MSELDRQSSTEKLILIIALSIFFVVSIAYISFIVEFKDLNAPPEPGDGPDYDAIAFQISKGRGFSINWDDPDFKVPYLNNNQSGKFDYLDERQGEGLTTYRPPFLPLLMSITYRIFGRTFWPIRVINSLFLAITCAIVFIIISRRFGIFPGLLSALLFFFDPRFLYYGSLILTEAPAILVVTVLCWIFLLTVEAKSVRRALWLGGIIGIAFLVRSVFILWVPIIALGIYALGKPRTILWFSLSAFRLPSFFLASFIIVTAPWMIRNCVVLGGYYPLGTMGSTNLSAAYSDEAVNNKGQWFNLSKAGFFDQLPIENMSLIEQEKLKADYSRDEAMKWALRNPTKVPLLAFFKIVGLWRPRFVFAQYIFFFGTLGFLHLIFINLRFAFSLFILIAACTFAVAVTWWTIGDRFLVPILPLLSMLAAVGIWSLWKELSNCLSCRFN